MNKNRNNHPLNSLLLPKRLLLLKLHLLRKQLLLSSLPLRKSLLLRKNKKLPRKHPPQILLPPPKKIKHHLGSRLLRPLRLLRKPRKRHSLLKAQPHHLPRKRRK